MYAFTSPDSQTRPQDKCNPSYLGPIERGRRGFHSSPSPSRSPVFMTCCVMRVALHCRRRRPCHDASRTFDWRPPPNPSTAIIRLISIFRDAIYRNPLLNSNGDVFLCLLRRYWVLFPYKTHAVV
jgi:hypothetical protein